MVLLRGWLGALLYPHRACIAPRTHPICSRSQRKTLRLVSLSTILRPEPALSALTGSHPGPTQLLRIWSQVKVGNKWKAEKQYKKRNGMLCFGQLLQISRSKPGVGKRSIVTLHNSNLLKASSAHTCSKVPAPVREFLL